MADMPAPRKHPATFEIGEEFTPVQFTVTTDMVNYVLIGINDRHPWYKEASPFGKPIVPPAMCHMFNIRNVANYLWGSFAGALFTKPAGIHYQYDVQNFDPIRVGEKISMKGHTLNVEERRGRKYFYNEHMIYGEDGRLCHRYVSTVTYATKGE